MNKFVLGLCVCLGLYSVATAQSTQGNSEIGLAVGAARYSNSSYHFKNGYRVGVYWQDYTDRLLYRSLSLTFTEDDGTYYQPDKWLEHSTAKDLQIGAGLGLNIVRAKQFRLFTQLQVGGGLLLGHETETKESGRKIEQSTRIVSNLHLSSTLSLGGRYYFGRHIGLGLGYDFTYLYNMGGVHALTASLSYCL